MKLYSHTRLALVCSFIAVLAFAGSISAQSGASAGSSGKKAVRSKAELKRERAKELKIMASIMKSRKKGAQDTAPIVTKSEMLGESESLYALAKRGVPPVSKENGPLMEDDDEGMEMLRRLKLMSPRSNIKDDLVANYTQTETSEPLAATAGTSFEGPGTGIASYTITGAPPDTTMAVGPNHIIAWVNSQYMVFDKSGTALLPAPGFVNGNTIWSSLGAGSLCATTNRGDPLVQYDRIADRWVLSQFAFSSGFAANSQCIAVSTTNNPLGTYYLYEYSFGNVLPDYGKLGIWNDAYYISYNMFTTGTSFAGGRACAYDKVKMQAGLPATQICFNDANEFSMLPGDIDGPAMPTETTRGAPFLTWNWPFLSVAPYTLQLRRLKPDFVTPANSTYGNGYGGAAFSSINFVLPSSVIAACNDNGNNCVPQLGTTNKLDTLGSRHMYRLAYRNRGGVDSLIVTQSVTVSGGAVANIKWYEIRNPLNDPADANVQKRPFIYQTGTFAPDTTTSRWMGSAAMNKYGDILIGYSISSSTTKPGIAFTGRQEADALNTLQAEQQVPAIGTGAQTGTLTRWGDYTTMQIDPADDETFWYIAQYLSADGTFNWRTRIISYKFNTTTATTTGDFNTAGNWTNGVPTSSVTGIVPAGTTMTVNSPTTIGNLDVKAGGTVTLNADLTVTGSLTLGNSINTGANTLALGCNSTVSGASASTYVIGNVKKDFCSTGGFDFPVGSAAGYTPVYTNVTTLTTNPSTLAVKPVESFRSGMNSGQSLKRYWTLALTGAMTTNLTFKYLDGDVFGTESGYSLYKWNGTSVTPVSPFTLNTAANTISANGISSFSDWTAGSLAPTAAGVPVSGRVMTASGSGLRGAAVVLDDGNGNVRTALTSSFGYYSFDNVEAGRSYTVTVQSKRYQFTPKLVTVGDAIEDLDFIAQ